VLQRQSTDDFVVFTCDEPNYNGFGLRSSGRDAEGGTSTLEAVGTPAATAEASVDTDDARLQAALEAGDLRQRENFGQVAPGPVASTSVVADRDEKAAEDRGDASGGNAKALYPFARILRDHQNPLPRHSYKMVLYDGDLERPHLSAEVVWPGAMMAREISLAVGLYSSCFQMVVRSSASYGYGSPVLGVVDAPEHGSVKVVVPTTSLSEPCFAITLAPGMDALGVLCLAVAAEATRV